MHDMPDFVDEKTGKRIFHENEITLKIQQTVEKKFATKGSFMHRDFDDDQPYDAKRAVDDDGKPILVEKANLSLFDVEYKLVGMNVVPVDKNTGKPLNEKQLELLRKQFLILSTSGGLKDKDGKPVALGFHTGHWELSSLVEKTANVINSLGGLPFSAYCSDPCDGRSMGTPGMFDSLPYRNDAAKVFRRIARSLPTAKAIVGIASCDKGLPAMMMALAGMKKVPSIIVPGGSTLAPFNGEDAGKIQSIGARFAQGEISLEYAQDMGCKACASPGGGCQFLGTAGTSQVIAESLGFSLTHSACTPSGSFCVKIPCWSSTRRAC